MAVTPNRNGIKNKIKSLEGLVMAAAKIFANDGGVVQEKARLRYLRLCKGVFV